MANGGECTAEGHQVSGLSFAQFLDYGLTITSTRYHSPVGSFHHAYRLCIMPSTDIISTARLIHTGRAMIIFCMNIFCCRIEATWQGSLKVYLKLLLLYSCTVGVSSAGRYTTVLLMIEIGEYCCSAKEVRQHHPTATAAAAVAMLGSIYSLFCVGGTVTTTR